MRDAGEDRRIGDLVPIKVKDWQHRSVGCWVEEFVRMPRGRERPGLGLTIADHAGDQQVRVVEGGTVGMTQRVPEFATLVDTARCLRCDVARDAAWEAELLEESL